MKSECKISPDGSKVWHLNGERHRIDGPAMYTNGTKAWWLNGQFHRVDGPAIERVDGSKEWYLNDIKLDPDEAINNPELKLKYPQLIDAIIIYLVHNS
jgi:hypothetical protein